ncbi:translocation/assembly module TamB domain-containing protein, partial [Salibacteraceae bacterium]|nr:translocation/assembly module TamB domain-containing protein [Salibacteraceae bacterium]
LSFSKNFFNDRVEVEVNGSVQNNSSSDEEEQTSNLAGEFNVDYKVNKDGSLVARVYNESNTQSAANLNNSPYTQGVGLQYRKEFDTWGQFFKQLFSSGNKEKNKE